MKYTLLTFLLLIFLQLGYGQAPLKTIVKNNYTSFSKDKYINHPDLKKYNSSNALSNPDFGKITPFTPCNNCIEEYDKRDATHRYFIETGSDAAHFYVQSSKIPLNYLNEQQQFVTIDYRLKDINANYYAALSQPVKTYLDKHTKEVRIESAASNVTYGTQNQIYFSNESDNALNQYTDKYASASYTAGDDGVAITEAYSGVNMIHQFKKGSVQTNFILKNRPLVQFNSAFLIIKEEITLTHITQVKPNEDHYIDAQGNYFGALDLLNDANQLVFKIEKPVMYDAHFIVFPCYYEYELVGNKLILYTKVPTQYLTASTTQYPITIDPWVTGYNKVGNFNSSGLPGAGMQFTYNVIGSCDYFLAVTVPGKSDIINTYVDVEDENELSVSCGTPPLPAPGCMRHDIRHNFSSDECGTSTGLSAPALPVGVADTPGTVTTDPLVIPGAAPILIPRMLDCMNPQCPDYVMHFTLGNVELRCGETCGNKCATGNMWAVTIEARRLEGYMTPNRTPVCAGQPVILTAYPSWGVPPYHYVWSTGDTTRVVTIYPERDTFVSVRIFDTCNIFVDDDTLIEVIPSPPADAGPDQTVCEGGSVTIGGSPTTTLGSSISWQPVPASAITYMSGTSADNPIISIPAGVLGDFTFIVRAADFTCARFDTVRVHSVANPIPTIVPDTNVSICEGGSVQLTTTQAYNTYAWSNGITTRTNDISNAGTYYVTVRDINDCPGVSNSVTLSVRPPLSIQAYPDTLIDPEQSAMLYSNPSMTSASVDSFYWEPNTFIPCTDCPNPISTPDEDITYTLHVLSDGCWSSDSATITLKYPFDFFMPNAFTPNGDGYNDTYYMLGSKVLHVDKFQVYDRYGELLWDITEPWTGYYKGVLLNPGVYIYFIEVSYKEEVRRAKGSITLIR